MTDDEADHQRLVIGALAAAIAKSTYRAAEANPPIPGCPLMAHATALVGAAVYVVEREFGQATMIERVSDYLEMLKAGQPLAIKPN